MHRLARPALLILLALAAACPAQDATNPIPAPAAPAPAAPAPAANNDPGAVKVLQDAAAAAKALTSLSYTSTFTGDLMGIKQKGKADVLMFRDFEHEGRWMKRWMGTHEVVSMETTQIQVSDQGDTITYISFPLKEYHKENAKYVNPRGVEPLVYAWIPEIAGNDPLNKMPYEKYLEVAGGVALGAPKGVVSKDAALGPVDDVSGVQCDVVTADFGPNQALRTWWFSKEDHLPRKLQWTFKDAGNWTWELSQVKPNEAVLPSMFELPVPEGFKRFDPPPPVVPGTTGTVNTTLEGGNLHTNAVGGARTPGLTIGTLAPDFTIPMITLDSAGPGVIPIKGKSFTLSAERSSIIVLDFFGSWNAQSKTAAPELARMAGELRGRPVKIISLAVRERDEAKPIDFLSQTPYATALLPAADEVAKQYKARVIPTYFVIGFEGEILYTSSTYARDATVKEMQQTIESYLKTNQPSRAKPAPSGNAGGEDSSGDSK